MRKIFVNIFATTKDALVDDAASDVSCFISFFFAVLAPITYEEFG